MGYQPRALSPMTALIAFVSMLKRIERSGRWVSEEEHERIKLEFGRLKSAVLIGRFPYPPPPVGRG